MRNLIYAFICVRSLNCDHRDATAIARSYLYGNPDTLLLKTG